MSAAALQTTTQSKKPSQNERQRVRRACEGCRKKKIKCNGEEPCQRCVNYSVDCEYAEFVPTRAVDASNVEHLETRMASMEQLFKQFLDRFDGEKLGSINSNKLGAAQSSEKRAEDPSLSSNGISDERNEQDLGFEDSAGPNDVLSKGNENDSASEISPYCYADGFGELDADTTGQFRYVGIGSTATVVDTCVGLRRHIHEGLDKKGYEIEEPFFTSPGASVGEAAYHTVRPLLQEDIPPKALVDFFIETFIRDLHSLFPILPQEDIRAIQSNVLSHEIADYGSAAIFFAILAISSLLIPPTDRIFAEIDDKYKKPGFASSMYNLSLNFVNSISDGIQGRKGKLRDVTVALGLLSMYLATIGMQAEAWIMVGRAIRHGQDLGFHRSPERLQLPAQERSRRRYIWWCLYVLERQLCAALGRPLSIDDTDCDVEIPCESRDGSQARETGGFISLIYLHRIMGGILKTVNSVKNVDSWREVGKYEELRARVRDSNMALQNWAKEHVPHEIRSAKSGKSLIQKHIALSAFFSAVLLLHRIFMSNPHRPSPLSDPHAQVRCAKAAMDCIRGASDFLKHVPRSHYLVFHGQYVFMSAVVLLQFVRGSNDPVYNETAFQDIQSALSILQELKESWNGANKCRAVVEEYLEFTYHVLEGGRKGICNFEHSYAKSYTPTIAMAPPKTISKSAMSQVGTQASGSDRTPKRRKRIHSSHTSTHHNNVVAPGFYSREKPSHELAHDARRKQRQPDKQHSAWMRGTLKSPHSSDQSQTRGVDGTAYFDNIVDNGLGGFPLPEDTSYHPDNFFQGFDFDFNSTDLSFCGSDLWTNIDRL